MTKKFALQIAMKMQRSLTKYHINADSIQVLQDTKIFSSTMRSQPLMLQMVEHPQTQESKSVAFNLFCWKITKKKSIQGFALKMTSRKQKMLWRNCEFFDRYYYSQSAAFGSYCETSGWKLASLTDNPRPRRSLRLPYPALTGDLLGTWTLDTQTTTKKTWELTFQLGVAEDSHSIQARRFRPARFATRYWG